MIQCWRLTRKMLMKKKLLLLEVTSSASTQSTIKARYVIYNTIKVYGAALVQAINIEDVVIPFRNE